MGEKNFSHLIRIIPTEEGLFSNKYLIKGDGCND